MSFVAGACKIQCSHRIIPTILGFRLFCPAWFLQLADICSRMHLAYSGDAFEAFEQVLLITHITLPKQSPNCRKVTSPQEIQTTKVL